jgi:hypothetical protein
MIVLHKPNQSLCSFVANPKHVNPVNPVKNNILCALASLREVYCQIAATDNQIDALVYELYALTPAEIALVDSATRQKPSSDTVTE